MHPNALLESAADLLAQALRFEHPADAVAQRHYRSQRLGPRERSALSDVLFAVLRYKRRLEHLARSGSGRRERRLAILAWPDQAWLQRALSPEEQRWLTECRAVPEHTLLAPQRHNLPDWLAQRLQDQVGSEFEALTQALLDTAPLDLRVNTFKAKRADVQAQLAHDAIESVATRYSPWGLRVRGKPDLGRSPAFTQGDCEVQDEGSQLLALLLDAHRGEMVADFCAGAGGKTLALGASMRNTGRLYAFDTSAHRLRALTPRLARSGLSNVTPVVLTHERDERVKRLWGKLDRVLVDAPCSGLGTLRRNPDLKWRQSPEAVAQLAERQLAILSAAALLLKPGGRLIYATCSLLREECEDVAAAFDTAHATGWTALPVAPLLQSLKVEDAATLCSGGDDAQRYLRLWPQRHGTDGFFAAVWQRQ